MQHLQLVEELWAQLFGQAWLHHVGHLSRDAKIRTWSESRSACPSLEAPQPSGATYFSSIFQCFFKCFYTLVKGGRPEGRKEGMTEGRN